MVQCILECLAISFMKNLRHCSFMSFGRHWVWFGHRFWKGGQEKTRWFLHFAWGYFSAYGVYKSTKLVISALAQCYVSLWQWLVARMLEHSSLIISLHICLSLYSFTSFMKKRRYERSLCGLKIRDRQKPGEKRVQTECMHNKWNTLLVGWFVICCLRAVVFTLHIKAFVFLKHFFNHPGILLRILVQNIL